MSLMAEKLGPVPVPIILGGAAIGLLVIMRKKSTSLPSTATNAQPDYGTVAMPNNAPLVTQPGTGISTNNDWMIAAEKALFGKNYDPTGTSNALGKYLRGDALTPTDKSIVDAALMMVGPAPQPPHPVTLLPETTIQAPPTAPPVQAPLATIQQPPAPSNNVLLGVDVQRGLSGQAAYDYNTANKMGPVFGNRGTYTVGVGETWSSIAKGVYGDWTQWPAIAAANGLYQGGAATREVKPGDVLWLPWNPSTTPGWAGFKAA